VHGRALGLPERTFSAAGSRLRWNEWLTFTEKYSDLSSDAKVEIRVYGSAGPRASVLLGSASAPLFDDRQQLIEGDVTLRFEIAPQHGEAGAASAGATGGGAGAWGEDEAEMNALEAMAAKHEETLAANAQPGLGWLDRPTYQLIEV
jgi:phosphatidylinositol 3-kinase